MNSINLSTILSNDLYVNIIAGIIVAIIVPIFLSYQKM